MSDCVTEPVHITIRLEFGSTVLDVPDDCGDGPGLWFNQLALPPFAYRYNYAPPSNVVPGQVLLGAVADASAVPVTFVAHGVSLTTLEDQKATLTEALTHWRWTLSLLAVQGTETAVLGTYTAFPTLPDWGPVVPKQYGLYACEATVSIPVNPPGA